MTPTNNKALADDEDTAQLAALGITSNFERSMTAWENFALGFTYLSPVVGVYTVFTLAFKAGGPPMFWSYVLVGIGQLLVAMIFGEVVSQFPISGGLYPWARRLVGKRWAWMAAWLYMWALCFTIAAVAVGGAPFIGQLLGVSGPEVLIVIAVAQIGVVTLLNVGGTKVLGHSAMAGFVATLIGAIAVGGYLLLFHRHQPLSVLFNTYGVEGNGSYLPAFLAASVAGMFAYYGFEACGDVAEETPNASRAIPKSMRMTIYVGGAASILICAALIMAIPNVPAVLNGEDADPLRNLLIAAMGETGYLSVALVLVISYVSCLLSLQASASRLLYSYARDEMIVGSKWFSRISPKTHVPIPALVVMGLVPSAIAIAGYWLQDAVNAIVSFAAVGIYFAFQMIVLATIIARLRGWQPSGPFRLGAWAWPVNLCALAFGVGAIINMVWPRSANEPWYVNYGMLLSSGIVIGSGLLYMFLVKPYDKGNAPAGDAHLLYGKNEMPVPKEKMRA
jgi:amino acid transporter